MVDIFGFDISIDALSAIVFVIALSIFLYMRRDKLKIQKIVGNLIYIVMYRTKLGIKLMDDIAKRFNGLVKVFGYVSIVLGFMGMLLISFTFVHMIYSMVDQPEEAQSGVALVVPFTEVPGIGYLSFWHWIIAIFILAVAHEFAHGVVARAHGLKIKSSGFAVFGILAPILPAAFVEPDEKQVEKKKKSVQLSVFAAGPAANMVLAVLFALVFFFAVVPISDSIYEPTGVSYQIINDSYPSALAGMPNSSTITQIDGVDVLTPDDVQAQLQDVQPGEDVSVMVGGQAYTLEAIQHPDDPEKAFIGIFNIMPDYDLMAGVEPWQESTYVWFSQLFYWLILLNLFIGLANLIPLGPIDGGRMLLTALQSVFKDEKKAQKVWAAVSMAFFMVLIFGLLVNYIGNPFALFR